MLLHMRPASLLSKPNIDISATLHASNMYLSDSKCYLEEYTAFEAV